jgi:chromate transporter
MTLWHILAGFFIANLLGYGGGPSTIPLIQGQVVTHYHFLTNPAFVNLLAVANSLPGPIATKLAAAIGYQQAGVLGAVIALVMTVVPSAVALILLLRLLNRYRDSAVVRGMTLLVQPVIAVLMALLTWQIGNSSVAQIGWVQSLVIALIAGLAMYWRKIHPVFVILAAFVYGGAILPHL